MKVVNRGNIVVAVMIEKDDAVLMKRDDVVVMEDDDAVVVENRDGRGGNCCGGAKYDAQSYGGGGDCGGGDGDGVAVVSVLTKFLKNKVLSNSIYKKNSCMLPGFFQKSSINSSKYFSPFFDNFPHLSPLTYAH